MDLKPVNAECERCKRLEGNSGKCKGKLGGSPCIAQADKEGNNG